MDSPNNTEVTFGSLYVKQPKLYGQPRVSINFIYNMHQHNTGKSFKNNTQQLIIKNSKHDSAGPPDT